MTAAAFDGYTLLQEQTNLLATSTPSDIGYIQFLKVRLNAQQKVTIQRNQWQRWLRELEGEEAGLPAPLSALHSTRNTSLDATPVATYADPHAMSGLARSLGRGEDGLALHPDSNGGNSLSLDAGTSVHAMMDERPAFASGHHTAAVTEEAGEEVKLEPCPYCGRTFAPDRVERHVLICMKNQQKEESMGRSKKGDAHADKRETSVSNAKTAPTATASVKTVAKARPTRSIHKTF